jgi:hypothetical protein
MYKLKIIENFEIELWTKKIIYILFYAFIFLSLSIPFFIKHIVNNPPDFEKMQNEIYLEHHFSGKVSKIYVDESNHGSKTITLTNGKHIVTNPFFSSNLMIEDSINKSEGDSVGYIYKPKEIIKFNFINNRELKTKR